MAGSTLSKDKRLPGSPAIFALTLVAMSFKETLELSKSHVIGHALLRTHHAAPGKR